MEKLNKLVEMAEKATPGEWWIDSHGHSMVSFAGGDVEVVFVTKSDAMGEAKRHEDTGNLSHWRNDNDATFIAAANPDNILAIAEAFRAMEQRAEAAEAKLAELERKKPIGMVTGKLGAGLRVSCYFMPDSVHLGDELFTRPAPAPAAGLAALVPLEAR